MRAILFVLSTVVLAQAPPPDIDALLKTANAAYRKADYAAARKSFEEAWTAAGELPQNDPKRYEILKDLSGVVSAAGDQDAAENYIELAINWRETVVGREDPLIAGDLIELATICERRKDFDRVDRDSSKGCWNPYKARGNFENTDVADDFSRIALVQAAQNKPEVEIVTLLTAIGIREKLLGTDSPGLLPELDRLGSAQITTRAYSDAEITFRRALVIRERIEGTQSPDLLTTLDGLAYSLFGEKQYEEAEVFYKRLLMLWRLVGNLPMIADTDEKIALFYREQKKWDEGTAAAADAIALRALVSAVGLSTEATAWISHGDKAHAIELYKKALTLLDPARKDHDGLRDQLEHVLGELDPPKATKAAPKKKQP